RMEKTLKEAQRDFEIFLQGVEPKSIPALLQWIGDTYLDESDSKPKYIEDANLSLREMAQHIKLKVPINSTLPSEKVACPTEGHDADCKEESTVNVDCFLYEDDDVDELVKQGKMSRSYCKDCNGRNIKELTFISHSLSIPQLEFMFTKVVPLSKKAEGYNVIDIGSRFGSICAAAHLYSRGKAHVTGIEINEDLCKLQEDLVSSFNLSNVDVVNSDVRNQAEVISKADLIVMNNVFSFFMSDEEQISCWSFLHSHIRPGCLLFHNPAIDITTAHLKMPFDVKKWLKRKSIKTAAAEFAAGDEELFEDLTTLDLYEVVPPLK
ncbi:hypothetical protein PFISCL1PPCAC_24369, partial [Pristionchus fissidentatus]